MGRKSGRLWQKVSSMAKNSFFRFKQFTVHQDKCAMKVCTDACVLGAWAELPAVGRILDIGAGTGLLSLMAAQRSQELLVDAVELDEDAWSQAMENVSDSDFTSRISLFRTDVKDFNPGYLYDCIITNPPFFQADLLSDDARKNKAHHATSLSFDELLMAIDRLLEEQGTFHILLPTDEAEMFHRKAVALGWLMRNKLILRHNKDKKPFRSIMTFARAYGVENQLNENIMSIYGANNKVYDPEFARLMKHFYMIF